MVPVDTKAIFTHFIEEVIALQAKLTKALLVIEGPPHSPAAGGRGDAEDGQEEK